MSYLIWKVIHIVSVAMFLGNITTGVFWAAHAHRTRDFRQIAIAFDGIIRSDRWFTMPGVFGIIVSGVAAAMVAHLPILATGWILWGIILFVISGAMFGMFIGPAQKAIVALASAGDASDAAWARYEALYRKWGLAGWVAILTPAIALVIMVLKPALPAFGGGQ